MWKTSVARSPAIEGAPTPPRAPTEKQVVMAPPEAPEAMETPTVDGAPIMEEVVEVTPRRAASAGSEGARSSPQPLVLEVAPGAGAAPSPP
jgi:hypothetical protein